MAVQHILRVRRTDHISQHVLINITRNGPQPLDLKFIATDQEHLFHLVVNEAKVQTFRSNNSKADPGNWKTVLSHVFLQQRPEGPLPEHLRQTELVAKIDGPNMTLTIQKNIDGITQKLGQFSLEEDDEREEVAAFDWVDAAVATSDSLREHLESLQLSLVSQQVQVTNLTSQLDELVRAKREHEKELLGKFALLLNSKKLKIRDQQRLLSGTKVNAETAQAVQKARSGEYMASRKPGISRNGKRRAGPSMDEDSNAMVVDEDGTGSDTDNANIRQQETPEGSDDEATEGEEEDDDDVAVDDDHDESAKGQMEVGNRQGSSTMEIDGIPPRRELPFARKPQPKKPDLPITAGVAEEEETDDEL